jgi:hypothetical protein
LRNPIGAVLGSSTGTGTILNDDAAPTVSVATASAIEGTGVGGAISFPVRLSSASGIPVSVHATTQPGSAQAGKDYISTDVRVTITPGQTTTSVVVPLVGDSLSEANEKFSLVLSRQTNARLGNATAVGTIEDDDPQPTMSIGDAAVVEGNPGDTTTMDFPVTLSTKSGRLITVHYQTFDGTAVAPDDYVASSGTLSLKRGTTSATIPIPVVGDNRIEGDEQFSIELSSPVGATITQADATGTIHDDESPPLVSVADTSVTEGDTGSVPAHYSVSLTAPSPYVVTVDYATSDGTAAAPDDYAATSGTVTFQPGDTEATVDVAVAGDTLMESDETFTLVLTNPTNATLGTDTATGTILDNDSRPVASVTNSPDVTEGGDGSGAAEADFTVSLGATTFRDVSIDYTTADGSAIAPDDYLSTTGTVTIPAGQTQATVAVPVVDDTAYESNEDFSLVLSNPVNASLGTDTASATILDDDPPPTLTIVSDVSVKEGDTGTTNAVFTVQLSAASGLTTTADYATSDVTATAPDDYLGSTGTVTIAPGDTTGTFAVPVVGDTLYEGDERFLVQLTGATNGAVSDDDFGAYGIILDDDPAPGGLIAHHAFARF